MYNLSYNNWETKESLFREKADKENYQKQIEDLSTQLKDVKINYKNYYEQATNELHSAQREFHAVNEEKKMLNKRINELLQELEILRSDYENKVRSTRMVANDCITKLNAMIRQIPYNFIAPIAGVSKREYLKTDDAKKEMPSMK